MIESHHPHLLPLRPHLSAYSKRLKVEPPHSISLIILMGGTSFRILQSARDVILGVEDPKDEKELDRAERLLIRRKYL